MKKWFLQRGERFYGPFTTDKVYELLKSGRVNESTLVSQDKSGNDARSLRDVAPFSEDELPGPSQEPPSHNDDESWMIVEDENNPRGPYKLAQLQKLLAAGKLKPETPVKKPDSVQVIELRILVPATPAPAREAPTTPRQATPRKSPALKPTPAAPKSKMIPMIIGFIVVVGLVAIGIAFLPMDKGKGLGFMEKLESTIQEKPSLTKMIKERKGASPPQYGSMVEKALRTGLNFTAEEVLRYNQNDLLIYDHKNAFEYGYLFPQTRREIRFSSDGGFNYTYLLDDFDFTFAVVVSGGNLDKHKLSHASIADFSTAAKPPLELSDQTIWQADITGNIIAKAVWRKRKNQEQYLDYVLVTSKEAEAK